LSKFIRLIQNENMKMMSRTGNWVMISFFFMVIFSSVAMAPSEEDKNRIPDLFGDFLNSASSPLIITILAIIWAASIMATEFSTGTIKLLLIRPVSRAKILWAKYALVVIYAAVLSVLYYVMHLIFGFILYADASISHDALVTLAKSLSLSLLETIFMITLTYMISVLSFNTSLALGLSLVLYMSSTVITFLIQSKPWAKFLFITQLNLAQYASADSALTALNTLPFALCVLGVYFILFVSITWAVFSSRDVVN
jgi:ABC-2 type transport system permease protein